MKRGLHCVKHGFVHILFGVAIVAGFSAITMLLWNWLAPSLFGWTAISFWQALGLLALSRILFGGFGSGDRRMFAVGRGFHKNPIRERWMKMTPEEREEFIKRHHFGFGRGFGRGCGHDFFNGEEPEKQD
jgi:hypothetical protein